MSNEEPLMYSQFATTSKRMKRTQGYHILRKPGEQIEVDWAGDPAHL